MLRNLLRDWWRGFTNEDLASALRKTEKSGEPGDIVWMSNAEMKAWLAFSRHEPTGAIPGIWELTPDWAESKTDYDADGEQEREKS